MTSVARFRSRATIVGLASTAAVLVALVAAGTADTRAPQDVLATVPLGPGVRLSGRLAPGSSQGYVANSTERAFVHVRISGDGSLLALVVDDARGDVVARRERRGGSRLPLEWRATLAPSDRLTLRLTSLERPPTDSRYRVEVVEWRPVEAADNAWIDVDRLVEEAEHAERQYDARAALDAYERARDVATRAGAPRLEALALLRLGGAYAGAGRTADAERAYVESRDRARSLGELSAEADVMLYLGRLWASTGRPDRAREMLSDTLDIRQRIGDVAGQAEVHVELAALYGTVSEFAAGHQELDSALAAARASHHRRAEADALNVRGVIAASQGDNEAAIASYGGALDLRRAIADEAGIAQSTNNLGVLHNSLGEPRTAIGHYEEALAVRRRLGAPQPIANTLHNLGVALGNVGQHERALALWDEALTLWRRTSGRRGESFTLQAMGQSAAKLGEPGRALALFDRALAAWRDVGDARGEAQTLLSVAPLHARDQRLDRATATFERALTLARTSGLKREIGLSLLGLATLLRQSGELERSLERSREALSLLDGIGERREAGRAWLEMGTAERIRGKTAAARRHLARAIGELQVVEDRTEEAAAHFQLALTAEAEDDPVQAGREVDATLDLIESQRADLTAERLRLSLFASRREYYEGALGLLARLHQQHPQGGFDAQAFAVSERMQARMLLDLIAADTDAGDRQPTEGRDLARLEELVSAKAARLTRLLSTRSPSPSQTGAARREIDELLVRLDTARGRLRRDQPGVLGRADVLDLTGARELARATGQVVVEYALTDHGGYAWVIDRSSHAWYELPDRAAIARQVAALHRTMGAASQDAGAGFQPRDTLRSADDFETAAAALSTTLLAPLWPAVRDATRLSIVVDGVLQAVPFGALPVPGSSAPLSTRASVLQLPSVSVGAALAARAASRTAPARRIAVFADPVFTAADTRLGPSRHANDPSALTLPRLRFSGVEAQTIASAAPGLTRIWSDFDATRHQVVAADLSEFGVLHFATHARLDDSRPQLSAVELSSVDRDGRSLDGSVRVVDVANLSLNARLVVLSGCRTALGRPVDGEGLIGLAREFLNAGAGAVLASVWDVDDRATAAFMAHFYREVFEKHQSLDAALRVAQTRMRADARWLHPADWAGWVLIGIDRETTRATPTARPGG
jgi:CHAT domain-containing protein/tetratricopeptide (TPR) repeat protein